MSNNEEYVEGYKKYDRVYCILISAINKANMIEGTVVGDVSYRYDYPTLAIHTDDMKEKDCWIEIDTDLMGYTKEEALTKLKMFIDTLESLYNSKINEVNK